MTTLLAAALPCSSLPLSQTWLQTAALLATGVAVAAVAMAAGVATAAVLVVAAAVLAAAAAIAAAEEELWALSRRCASSMKLP
jgi:hypothetical protein